MMLVVPADVYVMVVAGLMMLLVPALQTGRSALVSLSTTLLAGVLVYGFLEKWSVSDSLYFMVVTATTVGYGDLSPVTRLGRIFTCAYALIGTVQVVNAYTPFVERAIRRLEVLYEWVLPNRVDATRASVSLEQINQKISYPRLPGWRARVAT